MGQKPARRLTSQAWQRLWRPLRCSAVGTRLSTRPSMEKAFGIQAVGKRWLEARGSGDSPKRPRREVA
eukprot:10305268-Prorocentrum_lima.AAC.1